MVRKTRSTTTGTSKDTKTKTKIIVTANDDGSISVNDDAVFQHAPLTLTPREDLVGACRVYVVESDGDDKSDIAWLAANAIARELTQDYGPDKVQAFAARGIFWQELEAECPWDGVGLLVSHGYAQTEILVKLDGSELATDSTTTTAPPARQPEPEPATDADTPEGALDLDEPRLLPLENLVLPEGFPTDKDSVYWLQYHTTLALLVRAQFPDLVHGEKAARLASVLAQGLDGAALNNKAASKFLDHFSDRFNNGKLKNPAYSKEALGLKTRASLAAYTEELHAMLEALVLECLCLNTVEFVDSKTAASWGCDPAQAQPADLGGVDTGPQGMDFGADDDEESQGTGGLPALDAVDDPAMEVAKLVARKIYDAALGLDGTEDQCESIADCVLFDRYRDDDTADLIGLSTEEVTNLLGEACDEVGVAFSAFVDEVDAGEDRKNELYSAIIDELIFCQQEEGDS